MIYLISDTHFNHKNIMVYENRPFKGLDDMREQIILNWNKVVKPEDIIIHLGDVLMGNKEMAISIISRLNGHKILIKGNHDEHSDQWFLDAGFEEVHKSMMLMHNDHQILLTHQPYKIPDNCAGLYDLHFYGHVHGKGNEPGLYPTFALNGACLCVERINYTPISIDEVIEQCSKASSHFNETVQEAVEGDRHNER